MAQKDPTPYAFMNFGSWYYEAANQLLETKSDLLFPIQFLYFHLVESTLKAFLRSHKRPIRKTHQLTRLYAECGALGLAIGPSETAVARG